MLFLVTVVALVGFCSAQSTLYPYDHTASLLFNDTDSNGDGVLTKQELQDSFVKYDLNNDGRVSRHEYILHIDATLPTLHDFGHELYTDYDINGDHHLDQADYDGYYLKLDANADGTVTHPEFVDYWVKLLESTEHLHGHGHGHHGPVA